MTKRRTLRERAWESALKIWPGLRGSPWMRPNAEEIWLAGYRAANRDTNKNPEKRDALIESIMDLVSKCEGATLICNTAANECATKIAMDDWEAARNAVRAALRAALAKRDALKARAEKAEQWNRDMVAMAASGGKMDGYRELGAKLAAMEARAEAAEAENARLREAVERYLTAKHDLRQANNSEDDAYLMALRFYDLAETALQNALRGDKT